MMDFAGSDLNIKSAASQRDREARELARFADPAAPRGIRASLAARLARLAIQLDADTIRSLLAPDARIARRHG